MVIEFLLERGPYLFKRIVRRHIFGSRARGLSLLAT